MKRTLRQVARRGYAGFTPVWAAIFAFSISFGMITLIRVVFEHDLYFTRWTVFWLGNSIVIPFYAFWASYGTGNYLPAKRKIDSPWFTVILAVIGAAAALWLFRDAVANRGVEWSELRRISELYHTFVAWPTLLALGAKSIPQLWVIRSQRRTQDAMPWIILAVILYICLVVYDANFLPSRNDPGI